MVKERVKTYAWDGECCWHKLIEQTTQAARLTDSEKARLAGSLAAEVIAATAYISGCKDPDRMAVAHLTTFVAGFRCPELYGHRGGESLADRLAAGNYYPEGNPEAVRAGMLILEMISLNDHRADFEDDLIKGKLNPLIEDRNYAERKKIIKSVYCLLNRDIMKAYKKSIQEYLFVSFGWLN